MTAGLLIFHTQLIKKNLTTNEYQNWFRYNYLKDKSGKYQNPFNKGFCSNFVSRFAPDSRSYTPGRNEDIHADLLSNIV